MLVLRAVEGEENTYVRAASMRLNHYAGYRPPEVEFDPSPLHTLLDGAGWERRALKLI
jgi:hypothetical protein